MLGMAIATFGSEVARLVCSLSLEAPILKMVAEWTCVIRTAIPLFLIDYQDWIV